MNFAYDDKNKKDIIRGFSEENGQMIIQFLDGSFYKLPLTDENKKYILNIMLEQAVERSKSKECDMTQNARNVALTLSSVFGIFLAVGSGIITDIQYDSKGVYIISGSLLALCMLTSFSICGVIQKELNELKKYSTYLNFKDNFEENCDDPNIFNGVKSKEIELNINTLDNFSLKDIIKINENLNKSKEYKHCFTRTRK